MRRRVLSLTLTLLLTLGLAVPAFGAPAENKGEPKTEPKTETKTEPKTEPKADPKEEPKAEPKTEPKTEPKAEPKEEPKAEPKTEPKAEPKKPVKTIPVAVVDLRKAVMESAAGKAAVKPYQDFVTAKGPEFNKKAAEYRQLQEQMENPAAPLPPTKKAEIGKRAEALKKELEGIQKEAEALEEVVEAVVEQVRKEVDKRFSELCVKKGVIAWVDVTPGAAAIQGLPPTPVRRPTPVDPEAQLMDLTDDLIAAMADFTVAPMTKFENPLPEAKDSPQVEIETSLGKIVVELDAGRAPITVANFLKYVEKKHYDATIFHRVIEGFMIQGGGFDEKMVEKPAEPGIRNEGGNGLRNSRGWIAMARTSDPDSATAQFYINHKDNRMLDRDKARDGVGYAVFGRVISGMDIVDKIAGVPTGEGPNNMENVPKQAVLIKSIRRVTAAPMPMPAPMPKAETKKPE